MGVFTVVTGVSGSGKSTLTTPPHPRVAIIANRIRQRSTSARSGRLPAERKVRSAWNKSRFAVSSCPGPQRRACAAKAWRNRLNGWSGGHDTYQEIYDIAREIPADMLAENVEPRRWWKA